MKKLYHYLPLVILSVFVSLFIMLAEASAFTKNVLLDPDVYKDAMDQKSVSTAIYDELTEYFKSLSSATGIPPEVFTDPLSEEELYSASYRLLKDSLDYLNNDSAPKPKSTLDLSGLEKSIVDYIENDAAERQIKMDKEYKELRDNTVKIAKEQVESRLDTMMLYTLSKTDIGTTIHKHSGMLTVAFWVLIGLAIALMAVMVIIDRHHPRDFPYWLGLIMVVTSAGFFVPALILQKTNYFSSFFIMNEYIHRSVTGLFEVALDNIITVQLIILIAGAVLIISAQVIHTLYIRHLKKQWKKTHWHEDKEQDEETDTTEASEAPEAVISGEAEADPAE
ncbi:MAG: hypothetical protein IKP47_10895 [Ruminococcus sp.]|nr:hypothetical protein [Ruminococcus sp.]